MRFVDKKRDLVYNIRTISKKEKMMKKAFKIEVAGVNQNKIYSVIREVLEGKGVSRYELAEATEMSGVTVGKIVSEMLRRSLFVTEEQFSPRKRSPEKVYPADNINALVFRFTHHRLSATLCDLRQRILFSHSRPINESLAFEFDISAFADSVMQNIGELTRDCIVGAAVIAEREHIPLIKYAHSAIFSEAEIFTSDDCIADLVRREYPTGCVAHIKINHTMSVKLFGDGIPTNKDTGSELPLNCEGEESVIRFAADYLAPLFRILSPSRVLIDSDILAITPEFARDFRDRIKRAARLENKNLPEVTVCDELGFETLSAIGQIRDKLSEIFAGTI